MGSTWPTPGVDTNKSFIVRAFFTADECRQP
jgi:hypothetical protein